MDKKQQETKVGRNKEKKWRRQEIDGKKNIIKKKYMVEIKRVKEM
jgi:hypothetical protein